MAARGAGRITLAFRLIPAPCAYRMAASVCRPSSSSAHSASWLESSSVLWYVESAPLRGYARLNKKKNRGISDKKKNGLLSCQSAMAHRPRLFQDDAFFLRNREGRQESIAVPEPSSHAAMLMGAAMRGTLMYR